jgi:hypothetical protein
MRNYQAWGNVYFLCTALRTTGLLVGVPWHVRVLRRIIHNVIRFFEIEIKYDIWIPPTLNVKSQCSGPKLGLRISVVQFACDANYTCFLCCVLHNIGSYRHHSRHAESIARFKQFNFTDSMDGGIRPQIQTYTVQRPWHKLRELVAGFVQQRLGSIPG